MAPVIARKQNMFVPSDSNFFLKTISWHTFVIVARAEVTLSRGTLLSEERNLAVVSDRTFIIGVGYAKNSDILFANSSRILIFKSFFCEFHSV